MSAEDSNTLKVVSESPTPKVTPPTLNEHNYATREELLAYTPRATEDVYYPELDRWFQLLELSVNVHDRIRDTSMRPPKVKGGDPTVDISSFRRKLVIEALSKPKLAAEDFAALGEVGGRLFNLLQDAAAKLNGVTDDAEKDAESDSTTTQS